MPEFSLVLPVVDEERIIASVVDDIEKVLQNARINYEIILVENESRDASWQVMNKIAKNNNRIKVTKTKRGYGSAVLAGLSISSGTYVGYMPSDGQIDASILSLLWKEIVSGKYDLVKIKRVNRENLLRYFRSKIFNLFANFLFSIDMSDINGSPRIFKRAKLKLLKLEYKDSFIDTEFAVKANFLGWKIKDLPMRNLNRIGGKSTVRISTILEFLKNLMQFRLGKRLNVWKEGVNGSSKEVLDY